MEKYIFPLLDILPLAWGRRYKKEAKNFILSKAETSFGVSPFIRSSHINGRIILYINSSGAYSKVAYALTILNHQGHMPLIPLHCTRLWAKMFAGLYFQNGCKVVKIALFGSSKFY